MKHIKLKTLGAQTESATGDSINIIEDDQPFVSALLVLDVTGTATEVGDTLDVYVDVSLDGDTWVNAVHFDQVLGNGGAEKRIAKIDNGVFNDPDATIDASSDASAGVVRNTGIAPYIRYRSSITDASTDNASFTYSLDALLN